jgi:Tc5 transposase DNA-binding domain
MKLDGSRRKVAYPELDEQVADWVRMKRENKQPVSRRIILNEAANVFSRTEIKR